MPLIRPSLASSAILVGQVVPVDLERQLLGHQAGAAPGVLLHVDHGAHGDRAAPGAVGVADAATAHDQAVGREVRPRDPLHQRVQQLLVRGVEVVQVPPHAGRDLAQVVRRDLGRHADRDALGPVDEQVGEPAGQDHRLGRAAVVVLAEVNGVLVDVPQHLHGQRGQAALGVPHGRGRVVAGRAEVALASRSAASASTTAGPSGPGRRRSRCRRAGGSCPSPRR